MRLAIVVPRYSTRGGAENALRLSGEALAAAKGWDVEILTTCAGTSGAWENTGPAGTVVENGVTVHRFNVTSGRDPRWAAINERVKASPESLSDIEERQFFEWQGPVSTDLLNAVSDSDADLVWFAPYLFWPTIAGLGNVAGRAILAPAVHDEPFVRMPLVGSILEQAQGLVYGAAAEQALVERHHRVSHTPSVVLGWGIDPGHGDPIAARARAGVLDRPFVLCVGRIEHGKGAVSLAGFWRLYKQRHPGPEVLVFAGDATAPIAADDDIVVLDGVDDATKWGLLEACELVVNPSAMESFSLVLLESWHAAEPVLVNGHCPVTRDHATESRGGLWFDDYVSFEVAVGHLLNEPQLRAELATNGARYVEERFSWPSIADRFEAFADRVQRHIRRRPRPSTTP